MYGLILMGSPGAGKGSIGSYLNTSYHLNHFSSGDLLREEIEKKSEIGQKIQATIEAGGQVNDRLITDMVLNKLQAMVRSKKSFVLDGFPQTDIQKKVLEKYAENHPELHLHYVCVIVERDIALDRMTNRLFCGKCHKIYNKVMFPKERTLQCETCLEPLLSRKSDQIEKASTRLRIFTDTTEKLIQHLINPSIIDGNSSLTEVNQQVDIIMLHYHKEES